MNVSKALFRVRREFLIALVGVFAVLDLTHGRAGANGWVCRYQRTVRVISLFRRRGIFKGELPWPGGEGGRPARG